MEKVSIVLVEGSKEEAEMLSLFCKETELPLLLCNSPKEMMEALKNRNPVLLLLSCNRKKGFLWELCNLRKEDVKDQARQIVLLGDSMEEISCFLEKGAEDFIKRPFSFQELKLRLKAALVRLANQEELLREREFFKKAVKQEEEFSSRILDRQLALKDTLHSMADMKKNLIKSNKKLEKLAKFDPLSGLLNRQTLFSVLDMEVERAIRTGSPLSGIMLDLDYFKRINDYYGHPVGDFVIQSLGALLRSSLRKYDQAGRYGGEEFFIILPDTTQDQAFSWAERFRKHLASTTLKKAEYSFSITASLGIAQFRAGETREDWVSRADKAMYRAKDAGRNTTIIEDH